MLSKEFILRLNFLLDNAEADPDIRVIVLTATGNVFCAGADLKELKNITDDFIEEWQRLSKCQKPVICALNGLTLGGGVELALMSDIIVAHPEVRLGQSEINVGVIPGSGATQRLSKLIGPYRTNFLCMTGSLISAETAEAWGIVQMISNDPLKKAMEIAQTLTQKPLPLLKSIKRCVKVAQECFIQEGLAFERKEFYNNLKLPDHKEALSAFFEKRQAKYTHDEF